MRLIAFLLIFFPLTGVAKKGSENFESLLSKLLAPGPLIEGHKNLEKSDCLKCHEPAGGVPEHKCVSCHDEIGRQRHEKKHFHGQVKKDCVSCHQDHKGRNFAASAFSVKEFNHSWTGFNLEGAHAQLNCVDCHTEKKQGKTSFFGLEKSCKNCHNKDDVHKFTGKFAAKDCGSCHSSQTWKKASVAFDHAKETGYPLLGQHKALSCQKCHSKEKNGAVRYSWPGIANKKCLSCHEDFHGANLGVQFKGQPCSLCHQQNEWLIQKFNHSVTGFSLNGAHQNLACERCHSKEQGVSLHDRAFKWTEAKKECVSCHKDFHGFKEQVSSVYGPLKQCQSCHNERVWKPSQNFNHDKTGFKIDGAHAKASCFSCHKPLQESVGRKYDFPNLKEKSCETCHKTPHAPAFRERFSNTPCEGCHNTGSWHFLQTGQMGADFHDKTRFPLTGKHKEVSCNTCHLREGVKIYNFTGAKQGFCKACHQNIHKEQFHEKTQKLACAHCHETQTFATRAKFNHDIFYPLKGEHKKVSCEQCHRLSGKLLPTHPPKQGHKFVFADLATKNCNSCHKDPHKGEYGGQCASCHTEEGFRKAHDFHKDMPLSGVHNHLQCTECHKESSQLLKNMASDCINCHRGDDPHSRVLKDCKSCHSQSMPWEAVQFFHQKGGFFLSGAHRVLSCSSCHIRGVYQGTSAKCQSCHLRDALQIKEPDHSQTSYRACEQCHNTFHF